MTREEAIAYLESHVEAGSKEPVFVLLGRDKAAFLLIETYRNFLRGWYKSLNLKITPAERAGLLRKMEGLLPTLDAFEAWTPTRFPD